MAIADGHEAGLHSAHVRHGPVAGGRQVVEQELEQDRHQDDGPAPVAGQAVQPLQAPEQGFGKKPQEAVVNRQFQSFRQGFQYGLLFRADIDVAGQFPLLSGGDAQGRGNAADGIIPGRECAGVITVHRLGVGRENSRQEIMLYHGRPAVADLRVLILVLHIVETDFFVAVVRAGEHRAGIGINQFPAFPGRIIPFYLGVLAAFPFAGRPVFDDVSEVNPVRAALEFEYLGYRYAIPGRPVERHFQDLRVSVQGVDLPFRRERIPVCRRRLADDAALYDVVQGSGVIQQYKRLVFSVQGHRIIRQFGIHDGPAPVDSKAHDIRLNRHQGAARLCRAVCARQIRRSRVIGLYLWNSRIFVCRRRCLTV